MADLPNELWAIGAMVAQVFACATPGWREPFPLTDEEKQAVMQLRRDRDNAVQRVMRDAVLRSQACWVMTLSPAFDLGNMLCSQLLQSRMAECNPAHFTSLA